MVVGARGEGHVASLTLLVRGEIITLEGILKGEEGKTESSQT
jgi:hypothetical protein